MSCEDVEPMSKRISWWRRILVALRICCQYCGAFYRTGEPAWYPDGGVWHYCEHCRAGWR